MAFHAPLGPLASWRPCCGSPCKAAVYGKLKLKTCKYVNYMAGGMALEQRRRKEGAKCRLVQQRPCRRLGGDVPLLTGADAK